MKRTLGERVQILETILAEQSRKIGVLKRDLARAGNVAETGPWSISEHEGQVFVQSDDFHHDAALTVVGDFTDVDEKRRYANHIANQLNRALKQKD